MLVDILQKEGEDVSNITENLGANMILNKDEVLSAHSTEGVELNYEKIKNGIKAVIRVKEGFVEKRPVHLCFGMLPKEGRQEIHSKIIVEKGAEVKIISHCIFPNAENIEHIMDSEIIVMQNGKLDYEESHFHSDSGGLLVVPKTRAIIKAGGVFINRFNLKHGRVGKLLIDYEVNLEENAKSELLTKIFGRENDKIETKECINLVGAHAKGLIKSRVVIKDEATSKFIGITKGLAPHTRGHVDCTEVIMDNATASAIPEIEAKFPTAKLTHEAAIGQIDQKQLQTLMARGLSEDKAVDLIVQGLLA